MEDLKEKTRISLKNMRIRNQILLMTACLLAITVMINALVLSFYWSSEIIDRSTAYAMDITKQISKSLDAHIENLDQLAIAIGYSDQGQTVLKANYGSDIMLYPENTYLAKRHLGSACQYISSVRSIYLYTTTGYTFTSPLDYFNPDYSVYDQEWYQEVMNGEKDRCILGPFTDQQSRYKEKKVISVVRRIRKTQSNEIIGCIQVNSQVEDMLASSLQNIWETDHGLLIIANEEGQVIYDSSDRMTAGEYLEQTLISRLNRKSDVFCYEGMNDRYHLVYNQSPKNGWYSIRLTPYSSFYQKIRNMILISAMVSLALLGVAVIAMTIVANRFVRPIQALQRSMRSLKIRGYNIYAPHEETNIKKTKGNEITLLADSFNSMTMRLSQMVEQIYQTEEEKRNAELLALSLQIDPHFVYNTLGTIKQMAVLQNSTGIADLTDAVIVLFRAAAKYKDGFSTVEKELDLLQSYLFIQETRYCGNFQATIECSEELKPIKTLHFILQPIVENAIFHGIQGINWFGELSVTIQKEKNMLVYIVKDNGIGITEEEIPKLLSTKQKGSHLGIYNVNKRIQIYYGDEYGITIERNEPKGTIVKIRHPIVEEDEDV